MPNHIQQRIALFMLFHCSTILLSAETCELMPLARGAGPNYGSAQQVTLSSMQGRPKAQYEADLQLLTERHELRMREIKRRACNGKLACIAFASIICLPIASYFFYAAKMLGEYDCH